MDLSNFSITDFSDVETILRIAFYFKMDGVDYHMHLHRKENFFVIDDVYFVQQVRHSTAENHVRQSAFCNVINANKKAFFHQIIQFSKNRLRFITLPLAET